MNLKSIIDCHSHSNYSDDSEMIASDGVKCAIKAGLGGITFTDHLDLDYPDKRYNYTFDYAQRSIFLDNLQQEFADRAKILKGLELGFQPHTVEESTKIAQSYDYDFVIGSVHSVDGFALCGEASRGFYEGKTKNQAYTRYLEEVYQSVIKLDCFDVVGHIGYIRRYAPDEDRSLRYVDYADLLDAILKKAIDKGKGIEANTSGYYYKNLNTPVPDFDVLKRYKEFGGQILTIGSDSHQAQFVGNSFGLVLEKLRSIGFEYVTYFEKRKPIFVKI